MNNENNVEIESLIPFSNPTNEDFKAKWNNVEYTFPAHKRVPMATLIPGETQDGIRVIRAKFARELGIQEFYKSKKAADLNALNPIGQINFNSAVTYTDNDLAPMIQKCLEPLPVAHATKVVLPNDKKTYRATRVLDKDMGESLKGGGGEIIE